MLVCKDSCSNIPKQEILCPVRVVSENYGGLLRAKENAAAFG